MTPGLLGYLLAVQGEVRAIANTSCYTWINTSSQVELETTKLLKLANSLKGNSSFPLGTTGWLGFKVSDIFRWLPTGLRAILKSGLQTIFFIALLTCSIYFIPGYWYSVQPDVQSPLQKRKQQLHKGWR